MNKSNKTEGLSQISQAEEKRRPRMTELALPDFVFAYADVDVASDLIRADRDPNSDEVTRLRSKIGEVFNYAKLQLTDFPSEQNEVMTLLLQARKHLSGRDGRVTQNAFLMGAKAYTKAVIIWGRCARTIQTVRRMVWVVISVVTVSMLIIAALGWLEAQTPEAQVFGVPILIIIWGGIGGITAVLFRHRSTMGENWPFDFRWLWIVLRPLLGMIMGAFIYIAVVSGLLVFGSSSQSIELSNPPIARTYLLWGLAFIGGVSDKLWDVLINAVVGPFGQNNNGSKPD